MLNFESLIGLDDWAGSGGSEWAAIMGFVHDLRRATPAARAWLAGLLLAAAWMCLPASALNPERMLSQYAHSAWRTQDGVFGGIPSYTTQTADGYIWIGTNIGLVRFDGVRFVPWTPPPGKRLLDSRVFSLLGSRDGSLWIGTGYSVSRWKDGELTNYPQISGRIESLVEDDEGSVWLARTQVTDGMGPVCRMQDEQWRCFGAPDAFSLAYATQLARSDGGYLWVAGYSQLCRWKPGSFSLYSGDLSPRQAVFTTLHGITAARDGSVWVAVEDTKLPLHLDRISQSGRTTLKLPGIGVSNAEVTALFVDGNDELWIGTQSRGVFRVKGNRVEHVGSADGLSSDAVGSFFQDAEGTVWVATAGGIDNFRDVKVASYSLREGLSADGASSVLAARDGTVWIGNSSALDFLRDGRFGSLRSGHELHGRFATTLCEDHLGRLWVGADSGLWVYEHGSFRAVRHADGSSLGTIFSIVEDRENNIWVRAGTGLKGYLDRIQDMKLQEELTSKEISTAYILAPGPEGGVLLGGVNGDLSEYRQGAWRVVASHETGNTAQIRDLLVDSDGSVWGTTVDELAHWKDGRRRNLAVRNGLPCEGGIHALVKDATGDIWLYTSCGLMKIAKVELERWLEFPDARVKVSVIDDSDGVQPGLTSLKPQASRSPDGRLWFVNGRLLQVFDPAHAGENIVPPPVHMEEIVADRKAYGPNEDLELPALTRDLEIDYTALSFVAPKKVRFRYRLEGRDTTWQEPGTRRQAFYSDLPPAKYRFRVIACNNDGVWNETGADLRFEVLPMFYQTVWFRVFSAGAAVGLLWLAYFFRLRQATAQIQARLGARLEERERIARELHDTLLQGFQGLMLRFQAVMKALPAQGPARQMMEKALDRADEVLLEGRQRVRELRAEGTTGDDLPENLARFGEELSHDGAPLFSLAIVGAPQVLDPTVCNEARRIAREALVNAFQHARAAKVEVELLYNNAHICLRIRDDGAGIDQEILRAGRSGHWGLSGMRERAYKIGAQLNIWSHHGAGTEIELTIPARVAYRRSRKDSLWERMKRSRRKPEEV